MNLLNLLKESADELTLALKENGYDDLHTYIKSKGEMSVEDRISYYLGQVNLIATITELNVSEEE